MSTKTQIGNLVNVRIGEKLFVDVDTDGTTPADEFNAIWEPIVEEALGIGPEEGWLFARWNVSQVNVDNTAITAFALATATATTVTSEAHGLVTGDLSCITGTTSYNGEHTITKVDADNFTIVVTFVADDATGTVQWTSNRHKFRFARPTSIRVTEVYDGGVPVIDWTRFSNWILTNLVDDDVEMDYIRVLADLVVTDFPSQFIEVLWRKIAIQMLYARTQSRPLQDRLTEELEEIYLPRAKGMDAREKFVQEQDQSWVLRGHTGGVNSGFNLPNIPGLGRL